MFLFREKKILLIFVFFLFIIISIQIFQDYGPQLKIEGNFKKLKKPVQDTVVINEIQEPTILIWKYGKILERRHFRRFHPTISFSPWENCTAQCKITYESDSFEKANAVLFHLHKMTNLDAKEIARMTKEKKRNPNQVWVFLTDESPMHTNLRPEYDNLFNWSMTYRSDSDVPVPYGRTIEKKSSNPQQDLEILRYVNKKISGKTKLAVVMGSNCAPTNSAGSSRWKYVKSLTKILKGRGDLDIIGRCAGGNSTACPGHFTKDCAHLSSYKFYLSFENSNCPEYLSEKPFWNGYSKFSIPVIMGPPKKDCEKLLPPNSFLHVQDFNSPRDLADYLIYLDGSAEQYRRFHDWRLKFEVVNEHGYFGSPSKHYCRLCEALIYKEKKDKVYSHVEAFWSKRDCIIDDSSNFS